MVFQRIKNLFSMLTSFSKALIIIIAVSTVFMTMPVPTSDGVCFPIRENVYNSPDCAIATSIEEIFEKGNYTDIWVKFHGVDVIESDIDMFMLSQYMKGFKSQWTHFFWDGSGYGIAVPTYESYWERNISFLPRFNNLEVEVTCKIKYDKLLSVYTCYPLTNVSDFVRVIGEADESYYRPVEIETNSLFNDSYVLLKTNITGVVSHEHIKRINLTHGILEDLSIKINQTFYLINSIKNTNFYDFYTIKLIQDYPADQVMVIMWSDRPFPDYYLNTPYEVLVRGTAFHYNEQEYLKICATPKGQSSHLTINFLGDGYCDELENITNSEDCR